MIKPLSKVDFSFTSMHRKMNEVIETVNNMELDQPTPTSAGDSKPPNHSCTAEIIAELERLWDEFHNSPDEIEGSRLMELNRRSNVLADRIKQYKAKETQL